MASNQRKTDTNRVAARIVAQSTEKHDDALPPDLEAAWLKWSAGVGAVDERAMALLRAAFEAGAEAGMRK